MIYLCPGMEDSLTGTARFRGRINEIEDMEELKKGMEEIFCHDPAGK